MQYRIKSYQFILLNVNNLNPVKHLHPKKIWLKITVITWYKNTHTESGCFGILCVVNPLGIAFFSRSCRVFTPYTQQTFHQLCLLLNGLSGKVIDLFRDKSVAFFRRSSVEFDFLKSIFVRKQNYKFSQIHVDHKVNLLTNMSVSYFFMTICSISTPKIPVTEV